ncbi:hypothetical protein ACFY7C_06970 [Streptomyces sp. NPDC012769]|uniref:hypothetical protein n=1 Tax=Streptomyces sp. NPDC012769 TaxID=3364848 RepID=UPI0036D1F12B
MLPGLVVSGLGHGMIYTAVFVGGAADVPDAHQGVAGALMTTSQYAGGVLGVAVLAILLGDRPADARFLPAYLLAAALATTGALWAWRGFSPPPRERGPAARRVSRRERKSVA